MRRTGVIGALRLTFLVVGFMLFIIMTVRSAQTASSIDAVKGRPLFATARGVRLAELLTNGVPAQSVGSLPVVTSGPVSAAFHPPSQLIDKPSQMAAYEHRQTKHADVKAQAADSAIQSSKTKVIEVDAHNPVAPLKDPTDVSKKNL